VQQATASYVADQLVDEQVVTNKLQGILPQQLQALAPTVAGGVDQLAERATLRAMRSGAFQGLWDATNRKTHEQFVALVTGKSDNKVVFDLRPMIGQVADRVGLGADVVNALPADRGRITVVKPKELQTAQKIGRVLRPLAWFLVFLMLAGFVLAVYLAPERRRMLMRAGIGIFFAGLLMLAVRRVLGHVIVDSIAGNGATAPAAESVWQIGTSLLRQIAASVLFAGVIVMLSAWLAGPASWATRTRAWMTPTLRDQPLIAYSVAIMALLILLMAGIVPGSARIVMVLVDLVLVVVGVTALRRQVISEAAR
jgi:hypothetical protein